MKFLISTPSSLIIHENNKMSKVPQRYHEKYFKLKIAWNIVQIPNCKIAQPIELKVEDNWHHYYELLMIMTMKNNQNNILLNRDPFDPKVVPDTKTDILTEK